MGGCTCALIGKLTLFMMGKLFTEGLSARPDMILLAEDTGLCRNVDQGACVTVRADVRAETK